jgi:hypothetical protein
MNKLIILFLLVAVILTIGCSANDQISADNRVTIMGSGNLVSQHIEVSDFDKIETGFAFNISIHQGVQFSVIASVDDNLAEYLYIENVDGTLNIGLNPDYAYDIPQATMRAEVTMPDLAGLQLNGSSHASLSCFDNMQDFSAKLTGSSSLSGEIQAETTNLDAYGSTFVHLSGTGLNLSLDACGSNMIDLSDYTVEDASLQVACASTVVVNVDGHLEVDAAQNAQVFFVDNPAVKLLEVHEFASVQPK